MAKATRNLLLDAMVRKAMQRVGDFEQFRAVCPVNMVKGRKTDEGFGYRQDIDVSVQGQDSNGAGCGMVTATQTSIPDSARLKIAAAASGSKSRAA